MPRPGAAFALAPGALLLCDEGLDDARGPDEEGRERPEPRAREAYRGELRRPEAADDRGVDDAHRREEELRQDEGHRQHGHFAKAVRSSIELACLARSGHGPFLGGVG